MITLILNEFEQVDYSGAFEEGSNNVVRQKEKRSVKRMGQVSSFEI
jgi:hypothetical protein